ncbi:hypothetical protein EVAR_11753_1 [Eumeta japonica]|uniref:Uncharacterized protein n=1 Tax=Eumeta variegata TaxID=151549 RepID=A0A4C1UR26_EUMVA|nr:hypothetical protein EVAR_11753_1 [Eumeta japonica]
MIPMFVSLPALLGPAICSDTSFDILRQDFDPGSVLNPDPENTKLQEKATPKGREAIAYRDLKFPKSNRRHTCGAM